MIYWTTPTAEMRALKARLKTLWESGDYGVFATYLEKGALEFLDRLDIPSGARLLDVACGAGQLAIPAAQRGIQVTALDIAANLVEQARTRAAERGLVIRIDEGDAEQMPYPDGSFDVVMSLIGAMFAPRPELVAAEMIRVCRPGGRIVMGNWTPEGHVGQMFKIIGKHVPPPPVPSPLLWGDEATCRERFGDRVTDLKIARHMYPFEYPFPPEKVVDFFIQYYGPTNRAFASLNDERRRALHDELTSLWERNNTASNGTTRVEAEYLEVTATRIVDERDAGGAETEGVAIDSLQPGTTIVVKTLNSQYRFVVLVDSMDVLVRGGALFPEPTIVHLDGAIDEGQRLTVGRILVGSPMELSFGAVRIRSSRVLSVSVHM